ncbi:hypothetical protein [Variovorax sp. Root411]|uniref:hypothetical protein n=1 Tax=Variovorax sp. Root411 TaxID=1736530 RepID=UPI0006F78F61|nr:hypothetical protein [Variovorax sp. Root411]KQW59716.1 hypothetical protein ASC92_08945 [Variovorax sp. Root411]
MHVTDAQDVRRVSVLKATGLIEATIDPAFDTGGCYRLAQAALVICITDEGHAEIHNLRGRSSTDLPVPKTARAGPEPLDYLRTIERSTFPLRVQDPREIGCVETLKQAGFVDAAISPALAWKDSSEPQELAVIRRITPFGRAHLARRTK